MEFRTILHAQEIIFGSGALAQLGEAVARFGWERLLLCTTGSAQRNGHVTQIQASLGERLVAVYDRVQPHVQDFQVAEVVALGLEKNVQAVIALGGGSPIGMAKATSLALEVKRMGKPARAAHPVEQPLFPVVAIPTTYAGSEMTPVYGITHNTENPPRKITVTDPKIAPKLVIYDPQLTLELPSDLTASTGINALAHCVEALYSVTRYPLSSAAALAGVRYITRALPRCYAEGHDLAARAEMLLGAHLAGFALAGASMALHHGLCHVLGGSAGVPHGIANAIVLPHVIRFNAEATASQLAPAAEAMGIARAGQSEQALVEAAAKKVYELIGHMHLPQRLRDVRVKEDDLPRLAQLAAQSRTVQNNPQSVTEAQLEQLLREMW